MPWPSLSPWKTLWEEGSRREGAGQRVDGKERANRERDRKDNLKILTKVFGKIIM